VSDEEREQVVNYIKESSEASYDDAVLDQIERAAAEKETGKNSTATQEEKNKDYDDLLPQAADVIFDTKQASVSMLQRRLKLGYARAARLVDQLEEIGVVGPFEGSKPRQILITREQWQEMQYVNGTAPIEKVPTIPTDPQVTMTSADDLFESDESESEE
jgi:S-DNA-T family DNA segregation ATPase FtsK/SpoIIIE